MDLFSISKLDDVERIHAPTPQQFNDAFVAPRRPCVLTGVGESWGCVQNWTLDSLSERLSTIKVQQPEADGIYHHLRFDRVPFQDFASEIRAWSQADPGRRLYATADPILGAAGVPVSDSDLGGLAPDTPVPPLVPTSDLDSVNLWIGPGGNRSLLHYDPYHSLMLMVSGRKRFAIFPPDQTRNLYPYGFLDARALAEGRLLDSRIQPAEIDPRFERVENARGFRGEVSRGEMLFIPAGCWHYVESHGLNIGVNYWWNPASPRDFWTRPLRDFVLKRWLLLPWIEPLYRLARFLRRRLP